MINYMYILESALKMLLSNAKLLDERVEELHEALLFGLLGLSHPAAEKDST